MANPTKGPLYERNGQYLTNSSAAETEYQTRKASDSPQGPQPDLSALKTGIGRMKRTQDLAGKKTSWANSLLKRRETWWATQKSPSRNAVKAAQNKLRAAKPPRSSLFPWFQTRKVAPLNPTAVTEAEAEAELAAAAAAAAAAAPMEAAEKVGSRYRNITPNARRRLTPNEMERLALNVERIKKTTRFDRSVMERISEEMQCSSKPTPMDLSEYCDAIESKSGEYERPEIVERIKHLMLLLEVFEGKRVITEDNAAIFNLPGTGIEGAFDTMYRCVASSQSEQGPRSMIFSPGRAPLKTMVSHTVSSLGAGIILTLSTVTAVAIAPVVALGQAVGFASAGDRKYILKDIDDVVTTLKGILKRAEQKKPKDYTVAEAQIALDPQLDETLINSEIKKKCEDIAYAKIGVRNKERILAPVLTEFEKIAVQILAVDGHYEPVIGVVCDAIKESFDQAGKKYITKSNMLQAIANTIGKKYVEEIKKNYTKALSPFSKDKKMKEYVSISIKRTADVLDRINDEFPITKAAGAAKVDITDLFIESISEAVQSVALECAAQDLNDKEFERIVDISVEKAKTMFDLSKPFRNSAPNAANDSLLEAISEERNILPEQEDRFAQIKEEIEKITGPVIEAGLHAQMKGGRATRKVRNVRR